MNKHIVAHRNPSTFSLRRSLLAGSLTALLVAPAAIGCGGSQKQQEPRAVRPAPTPAQAERAPQQRPAEREPMPAPYAERAAPMSEEQMGAGEAFSQEDVKKFAEAHPEVIELQNRYLQLIQRAESNEQAQELQEQAMVELNEVVERHGLTLEQFTEIAEAASTDPEMMEQIRDEMGG